jgi:raffinose/stachyose/melibiose transport system substrate-binding protein
MKKILVVLISLVVLTGTLFAGGGGEETTTTATETVVVDAMAYGNNSNPEGVNWIRIVDTFEEMNPNIDIKYEMLYDEAYHQKVTARLASGDIPDLAYMGADARWGAPWAEAKQQFDHTPYIDDNFYDLSLIPEMGPNGEIYEIPLGTSNICTVLYMNEALVNSLGFSEPKTYEDIVAMVPAAKAAGLDVITIDGADGWAWGSCLMSMIIARMSGDAHWISDTVNNNANKFTDAAFVDSLAFIRQMVDDGVISEKSLTVDYGTNQSIFSNEQALFMIQGQWIAGDIDVNTANHTKMLAWPELPGEKRATAGCVAAAIQVGYGLTKKGASDPAVRDAALKFLQYFFSVEETTQRLRDGAIVAPILKDYQVPADLPYIVKQKVGLAQTSMNCDVIDAYLSGAANDALNAGMQKIVAGTATPEEIAAEVQQLFEGM